MADSVVPASSSGSTTGGEDALDSEQVEALEAALAPQMKELESLMDDPLLKSSLSEMDLAKRGKEDTLNPLPKSKPRMVKELSISRVISEDDTITVHSIPMDDLTVSSRGNKAKQKKQRKREVVELDSDDEDYGMNLEDDDMDQELEQLAFAEDMLRRELDMAKDFATFFGNNSPFGGMGGGMDPEPSSNFMNLNFNLSYTSQNSAPPPQTPQRQPQEPPQQQTVTTPSKPDPMASKIKDHVNNYVQPGEEPPEQYMQSTTAIAQQQAQQTQALAAKMEAAAKMAQAAQIEVPSPARPDAPSISDGSYTSDSNNPFAQPPAGSDSNNPFAQPAPAPYSSDSNNPFATPPVASDSNNPFAAAVSVPTMKAQQHEADLDGDEDLREEDAPEMDHNDSADPSQAMDGSFDPQHAIRNAPQETMHFDTAFEADSSASAAQQRRGSLTTETPLVVNNNNQATAAAQPQPAKAPDSNTNSNTAEADTASGTNKEQFQTPTKRKSQAAPPETPQTCVVLFKEPNQSNYKYTSTDHFHKLRLRKEPQGAWYSVDLTSYLVNTYNTAMLKDQNDVVSRGAGMGIKEYCLSITQWKRLFVGLRLEGDEERAQQRKLQKQQQQQQQQDGGDPQAQSQGLSTTPSRDSTLSAAGATESNPDDPTSKRAPVRTVSIRIRPDVLCGAVMDAVTQTLVNCPHSEIIKRQGGHLQATVRGQVPAQPAVGAPGTPGATPRSASRRSTSFSSPPPKSKPTGPRDITFFVDVQLCTHKSSHCERVLLLRIFHWGNESGSGGIEGDMWSPSASASTSTPVSHNPFDLADAAAPPSTGGNDGDQELLEGEFPEDLFLTQAEEAQKNRANLHLREACALIQRIESPELAKKIRPLTRKVQGGETTLDLQEIVSEHLLHSYRACPSVMQPDTAITLPALSPQDWPVIQATWGWIHSVWDELETRELTYLSFLPMSWMTMTTNTDNNSNGLEPAMSAPPVPRFGAFPALPTLDVQYCSQLRRLSREAMIGQLLKAASVLEDYARQAEYQCANLIDLLRPTFAYYQVQTPSLPKPAPLASYPLEYTPPQSICPPWGIKVMEALNKVAAMSHDDNASSYANSSTGVPVAGETGEDAFSKAMESINLAETAVQMVYQAFQQQDDEEHSARLARKNLQVMDRLTKMQEHNRASTQGLGEATTPSATAAADDFFKKAEKAIIGLRPKGQESTVECCTTPWREVPLLKWTLGVGGSSGTCTITPNQLLFTPAKLIPLLGYSQSTWFFLGDIEFDLVQTQATLLNPLTTTLKVQESRSGVECYNFKPSSAGQRLKSFLDIVQKEAWLASQKRGNTQAEGEKFSTF